MTREGETLTEEQVIDRCPEKLSAFHVPRTVEFRAELPRNPSGKLLKRVLRAEFWGDGETKA